jgi:hypothetical protein
MRFRPSDGDLVSEILDALGARDPLWRREWIPEDELRELTRDRREFARAIAQIQRREDILVHIRSTENGRSFFLAKADASHPPAEAAFLPKPRGRPRLDQHARADTPGERQEGADLSEPGRDAGIATPAPVTPRLSAPARAGRSCLRAGDAANDVCRAIRGIGVRVDHVDPEPIVGPTVVRHRVYLAPDERVRHLQRRAEDLARGLGSEVFVWHVPGEKWVAVDLPRKDRQLVPLAPVLTQMASMDDPAALWVPVGVSPSGEPAFLDLTLVPHLLIAGGTGGGKSVWLRSALLSLVLRYQPSDLEVLLVDPKAVDYLAFSSIPHLRGGRIVTEPEEAVALLMDLTGPELARRTRLLQDAKCSSFRELRARGSDAKYLVLVVDEFADLAVTLDKPDRAEFERQILRLAQRARAAGIFLILATQRPTVEFITGAVKANLPTRISFRLPQRVDSQVILDEAGAEALLGAGDLLLRHDGRLQRLQGYFASTEEAARLLHDEDATACCEEPGSPTR